MPKLFDCLFFISLHSNTSVQLSQIVNIAIALSLICVYRSHTHTTSYPGLFVSTIYGECAFMMNTYIYGKCAFKMNAFIYMVNVLLMMNAFIYMVNVLL